MKRLFLPRDVDGPAPPPVIALAAVSIAAALYETFVWMIVVSFVPVGLFDVPDISRVFPFSTSAFIPISVMYILFGSLTLAWHIYGRIYPPGRYRGFLTWKGFFLMMVPGLMTTPIWSTVLVMTVYFLGVAPVIFVALVALGLRFVLLPLLEQFNCIRLRH